MGKTAEELEQLLKFVRDEDVATLRTLERRLHSLLEEKERNEATQRQAEADRDFSKHCPDVSIDPELLALVGVQPENPVQDDKPLIRDAIARRLSD